MRHIVDYPRRSGDFRQLVIICQMWPFQFAPQVTSRHTVPYTSYMQRGTSFRTPPLKPFTSTSWRAGRTVSNSNGMFFSGSTLSHRRFHHTETSSLLQKSHQSPLLTVKCTVMVSPTSSGNPSQRRWPIPLCNQSSCSFIHPVAHRSAGASASG